MQNQALLTGKFLSENESGSRKNAALWDPIDPKVPTPRSIVIQSRRKLDTNPGKKHRISELEGESGFLILRSYNLYMWIK